MTENQTVVQKSISADPIYYITVVFFAILTTALPATLGQPRFLPIIQSASLITFVAVALHNRNYRGAISVMALWLPLQFIVITLLTRFFLGQVEHAFGDGFAYRSAITTWFFAGAPHPNSLATQPWGFLTEFAGIVIGSLATAGLIGAWFLVRLVNLAAYGTGVLLTTLPNPIFSLLVIPYWTLVRAAGYGGLIVLCAMPLLTNQWSPTYYWHAHRRLIVVSLTLVVLGFVAELVLPGLLARRPLS